MESRAASRRRKHASRLALHAQSVFLVLAVCAAALSLLSLIAKDRPFSDRENRALAQRPTLTWSGLIDGSFFSDASDYLTDQFYGRDAWITLDTARLRLMRQHEVNGVYLGEDGYLFSAPETPEEALLAAKTAAVNDYAARNPDLHIAFLLAPDSASVLTDKLPANAPLRDQIADITAVTAGLSDAVTVIDAAAALRAHAGEDIYYRTDHHWTSLGAYYAFGAGVGTFSPDTPVPTYELLPVTKSFEGTLASRSGVHDAQDTITVFLPTDSDVQYYVNYVETQERVTSLYVSSALDTKDKYTVFLGGNHPLVEIWTTANTGRSLLVFKDSYANCFIPFLTTSYDRIILIDPRYYYDELGTAATAYGITDVLFLYSADTWMTDRSLPDVLATG